MTTDRSVFRWLTFDMILFVLLFIIAILYFDNDLRDVWEIGYFEVLVLGLATYRLANIVSTEKITKPLREPFVDEVIRDGEVVERPKREGFLGATGLLIYCPSCSGVWVAALLVYAYLLWPLATLLFAIILALSGIERIIANISNWFRDR